MQHETLTYQADNLTMKSELFFEPAAEPRAGVLVFPEAFGLGEHAISRAERLAALGYVAWPAICTATASWSMTCNRRSVCSSPCTRTRPRRAPARPARCRR